MDKKVLKVVSKEEKDSMVLINTKITCAEQAMKIIPSGLTDDESKNYVKGCIDSLAEYRWLEKDWWDIVRNKYDITKEEYFEVYLDFDTGELYVVEE